MNTLSAVMLAQANAGQENRVFDWDRAVDIIKERGIRNCGAGLEYDLENTEGEILRDGEPVTDSYTYLRSNWACPVLVDYDHDYEEIPCFVMDSQTDWDQHTKWPESALKKLEALKV